jgi:hypothetical protein
MPFIFSTLADFLLPIQTTDTWLFSWLIAFWHFDKSKDKFIHLDRGDDKREKVLLVSLSLSPPTHTHHTRARARACMHARTSAHAHARAIEKTIQKQNFNCYPLHIATGDPEGGTGAISLPGNMFTYIRVIQACTLQTSLIEVILIKNTE